MIGKLTTGSSFYHCISYCLEDKQDLTEVQKIKQSLKDHLQHKDRAEVLEYNLCFGNKQELADQFNDVRKLSKKVEKPVLHLSLRLSPGERLDRSQLVEMARELAKEFGVSDHQYVAILHKGTSEQHIHLVANRVGYDGKAIGTSNDYLRMDRLCRRLEKQYRLKEVLSARRFLSKEQRLSPRQNIRMEKLKTDLKQTLGKVKDFPEFEKHISDLGYKVIKGRGICFIDDKNVKIKGSEVGFSLATIEKILKLKQEITQRQEGQKLKDTTKKYPDQKEQSTSKQSSLRHRQNNPGSGIISKQQSQRINYQDATLVQLEKQLGQLISAFINPVPQSEEMTPTVMREEQKRIKKRNRKRRLYNS